MDALGVELLLSVELEARREIVDKPLGECEALELLFVGRDSVDGDGEDILVGVGAGVVSLLVELKVVATDCLDDGICQLHLHIASLVLVVLVFVRVHKQLL